MSKHPLDTLFLEAGEIEDEIADAEAAGITVEQEPADGSWKYMRTRGPLAHGGKVTVHYDTKMYRSYHNGKAVYCTVPTR